MVDYEQSTNIHRVNSVMAKAGGFGQDPLGQHEAGAGQSTIEPRFNFSLPRDEQRGVARTQGIEFTVYYFSSFPNMYDPLVTTEPFVQISEDGGTTYNDASAAPYTLTYRLGLGGHTAWYKIIKDGLWPVRGEIKIKNTLPDEFEQAITKAAPLRWPDPS